MSSTTAQTAEKRSVAASDRDQESSQEPGPPPCKRRRIGLACNACRVRKSRCDGQRPSCASCLSLGFGCLYEPGESAANVIVRKDYMSDLEHRVTTVEKQLQRLDDVLKGHLLPCGGQSSPGRHPSSAAGLDFAAESGPRLGPGPGPATARGRETHATGLEEPPDEDASANGMAMIFVEEHSSAFFGESSNIHFTQLLLRSIAAVHQALPAMSSAVTNGGRDSGPGESLMANANHNCPYRQAAPSSLPSSLPHESPPTALPSVEEMDSMLDLYFETAGTVFPFIHEETMRRTYAECRRNNFTRARRTWLGVLNMMFAMANSFDRDACPSARKRLERSNVYYRRASELCGDLSKRVISLEMVHYLVLGVIHCQGTQRSVQAWNNQGLAIRSAMALGLHTPSAGHTTDPVEREYRHRTWEVIYILDKMLSVAFGRPAGIPDDMMRAREPFLTGLSPSAASASGGGHRGGSSSISSTVESTSSGSSGYLPGEFLAVSVRLYQIMGNSLTKQYGSNYQNSDSSHHWDDTDSLRASSELRRTLQVWAASLPPQLGLCEPDSILLSQNTHVNRLRVILTLRYHNLGILLHKPLLSATIRHMFRADGVGGWGAAAPGEEPSPPPPPPAPYALQLAMAEAHQCIRAAEQTIDIVHAIISTDPTGKNNLGVWSFTLYYVFTASLVVSGRLLWALHGESTVDEGAVAHSKALLAKAENVFSTLDLENSLVQSCLEYTRRISRMCSIKGTGPPGVSDVRLLAPGSGSLPGLSGGQQQTMSSAAPTGSSTDAADFTTEDMEAFRVFSSEMFDPSIFEGFGQSPVEGIPLATTGLWDGF